MQFYFFVEMLIGAKIESKSEAFPAIGGNPVEPGADLVITDILIASANKGQGLGEFLKDGCLCQCINHFNDAAFCLTQGFMPGRCPEILWLLCRLWKGDDFFHRFILL